MLSCTLPQAVFLLMGLGEHHGRVNSAFPTNTQSDLGPATAPAAPVRDMGGPPITPLPCVRAKIHHPDRATHQPWTAAYCSAVFLSIGLLSSPVNVVEPPETVAGDAVPYHDVATTVLDWSNSTLWHQLYTWSTTEIHHTIWCSHIKFKLVGPQHVAPLVHSTSWVGPGKDQSFLQFSD